MREGRSVHADGAEGGKHITTGGVVGDPRTICSRATHWTWQSTPQPSPAARVAISSLRSGTVTIDSLHDGLHSFFDTLRAVLAVKAEVCIHD